MLVLFGQFPNMSLSVCLFVCFFACLLVCLCVFLKINLTSVSDQLFLLRDTRYPRETDSIRDAREDRHSHELWDCSLTPWEPLTVRWQSTCTACAANGAYLQSTLFTPSWNGCSLAAVYYDLTCNFQWNVSCFISVAGFLVELRCICSLHKLAELLLGNTG